MLDLLAEHEFLVAQYYFKRSAWEASRKRFEGLFAAFPEYSRMEKALYWAGLTERRLGRDEDARPSSNASAGTTRRAASSGSSRSSAEPPAAATASAGL